jgi:hypothetical protein
MNNESRVTRGVVKVDRSLSGVPQGSLIGPLLFPLYIIELPKWMKISMRMFADDT